MDAKKRISIFLLVAGRRLAPLAADAIPPTLLQVG